MDSNLLRSVGSAFVTGITVITTKSNSGQIYGMTANSFTSVSLNPPLVLFVVNQSASISDSLKLGKNFGISILATHQQAISQYFGGQQTNLSLEGLFEYVKDIPIIKGSPAWYTTEIVKLIPAGTHNVVICKVLDLFRDEDFQPLIYFSGKYYKTIN